jgi:hypothetical protein|tara:strand:- start:665 stop:895 length:231 start_codon:yes stop_codon:yes gene_type:complete
MTLVPNNFRYVPFRLTDEQIENAQFIKPARVFVALDHIAISLEKRLRDGFKELFRDAHYCAAAELANEDSDRRYLN